MSNIELKEAGRRLYIVGNSYPIKAEIKAAGGHWDSLPPGLKRAERLLVEEFSLSRRECALISGIVSRFSPAHDDSWREKLAAVLRRTEGFKDRGYWVHVGGHHIAIMFGNSETGSETLCQVREEHGRL